MLKLICVGIIIHAVLFYSIFDIYFTSPLVHGMAEFMSDTKPPAKRLILFVADGLRADKFFELDASGQSRAPYLRNIIETSGSWGISHTRMPTESRPGHVALIAGFYEDVSAVAKGWKENPVEFDSLFNASQYTWSWGSPDILPMFAKGAKDGRVMMDCYSHEAEDFASSNSSNLDTWVFDKFRNFLESSKSNHTLHAMLHQERIIFFLHLLGIDVNGHSHKPHSQEYLDNIRIVDSGIKSVVNLIEDFYQDKNTAYVMTADHGMTNWGSHGAGHSHETLTPLVAWGSGINEAKPSLDHTLTDLYSNNWKLDHLKRNDVNQADICVLMAAIIGTRYPVNSVGTLPLEYLNTTDNFKAKNLFTNAKQILAQYQVKRRQKQKTTFRFLFRQFHPLTESHQQQYLRHINKLIMQKEYLKAISLCEKLIKLSLEGLTFYHKYDRVHLGFFITLSFLGWICYTILLLLSNYSQFVKTPLCSSTRNTPVWGYVFQLICGVLLFIIPITTLLGNPWMHLVYGFMPMLIWREVFSNISVARQLLSHLYNTGQLPRTIGLMLLLISGLELLVLGFFYRGILSFALLVTAACTLLQAKSHLSTRILIGWVMSCGTLSIFPLMPVIGRDANYSLVVLAGCVTAVTFFTVIYRLKPKSSLILYAVQLANINMTTIIVKTTSDSIASKQGLPFINQILSWLILVTSFSIPLFCHTRCVERIFSVQVAFAAPYLLLSIAHEGLFLVSLYIFLFLWLYVEHTLSHHPNRITDLDFGCDLIQTNERKHVTLSDVKVAYFSVLLLLTSFFGTGNIASVNSFDPTSVYCFLTVFSPFTMGALMMFKNVIPFLIVTVTFQAIHQSTRLPTRALFLIVIIMSDFMALNFFFLIRDSGSWLDIGASISHYVIVMAMIVFYMLLHVVSIAMTRWRFNSYYCFKFPKLHIL